MKNAKNWLRVRRHGWRWPNAYKPLCILLLLTIPLVGLPAQLSSLEIGTGNDWITFGLGNNQDDGHSFSAYLTAQSAGGLGVSLTLDGITDQQISFERYGILSLTLTQHLDFYLAPAVAFTVEPALTLTAAGNLGLQSIQNTLHDLLGRRQLSIPLADQAVTLHPGSAVKTDAALLLPYGSLHLRLSASYAHRWQRELGASLSVRLVDALEIGGGYNRLYSDGRYPSQRSVGDQYSGPFAFVAYDGSLIKSQWRIFPIHGFSYGTFGFDVLALGRPKRFIQSDWVVVGGIQYDVSGYQTRLAALRYGHLSLGVRYSNGPLAKAVAARRNVGIWSVGWFSTMGPDSWLLRPALELYGGFKRLNLMEGFAVSLIDQIRPVLGIEVGLPLGPKEGWVIESTAYLLRLAVGLHHTFATDSLKAPYADWEKIIRPWTILFGLVLEIHHDSG